MDNHTIIVRTPERNDTYREAGMNETPYEGRHEVLENIAALIAERLPQIETQRLQHYATLYYAPCIAEDLQDRNIEDLYGAMLGHYHLAHKRVPGVPTLRIYNPSFEEFGWQSTHTVVEVATDDMPFLVDSLSMELVRHGLTIHYVLHPVLQVRRDTTDRLVDTYARESDEPGTIPEAHMRFEVDRQSGEETLASLHADLLHVLADVRFVVEDWPRMRAQMKEIIITFAQQTILPLEDADKQETLAFLHWLDDHHFTYIGFRAYDLIQERGEDQLRAVPGSGLGVTRETVSTHISQSFAALPAELRAQARGPAPLVITKSTARSTVHRPAHLDYIGIKRFNAAGEAIGEWRFLGLYSSVVYNTRPSEIPNLRKKVDYVLQRSRLTPASHGRKALQHILDTFPRDDMFQAAPEELFRIGMGILRIQERHRLSLFLRADPYGRFITALVYVPRDRYNTDLRVRMQNILMEALNGLSSEFDVLFTESVLARVRFVIRTRLDRPATYDAAALEARLAEATASWEDALLAAALEHCGEAEGIRIIQRYGRALPAAYREDYPARTAVADLLRLEGMDASGIALHLYRPLEGPEDVLHFKIYGRGQPLALSDALPMLERMGLRVLTARPYVVTPRDGDPHWILDFALTTDTGITIDVPEVKDRFQDAYARICRGEMENDGFNHLVLAAGLPSRDVILLRAVCKYLLQIRLPFSQTYMEQTLAANPQITGLLAALFHTRFDPTCDDGRKPAVEMLAQQINVALESVANLDEDRILRQFLAVIQAMLRTNYYQHGADGLPKPCISFKLDPSMVPELPLPRPMFEFFVYSLRVEGVHLRGGRIARGGIRWSDRREDFRTEVLGLMKAQMVKNTVIVPVGAKGGFVVKQPSAARDALKGEVVECYRTFIGALLDLTDNWVSGQVVPPRDVVRYDNDDPYLVVAADKGTATFSDISNGLSLEHGYWLGDAFASGGSTGYDHKKMGITARGAWESVKRHFRELGTDIQTTPFTVVGIGGMSGDVFGNGMLQSRCIKLVAAFNHNQIFIDPIPDPEASYQERERLFRLPHCAWTDYNPALISAGGGVYSRSAKSITLSEQAQRVLGIEQERLTPNELVKALLRAPVDLLWNGGIGTYVKASSESHADVGDRSSDAVRVDGAELRCRVVGEGGNLGFTQLARVEYARQGGRVNTDAIDNSSGVDCSDHEVNIKILLDQVVRGGDLTEKQRNELLAQMTDEVAALVIRDNYLQTQALSIGAQHAPHLIGDHARLIRNLEREGRLRRRLEFLPSDERLEEREAAHEGLTRPELAVLLAYSKIKLHQELITSDIAEDPYLAHELEAYFPAPLRTRFRAQMQTHPLRREIICTQITCSLVHRMGSTFVMRMQDETGEPAADIARAYTAAREIFRVRELWSAIESLDNNVVASTQLDMITATRRLLDRATLWLLRKRLRPLDIATTVACYATGTQILVPHLARLLKHDARAALQRDVRQLTHARVPKELAQWVATLEPCYASLDLIEVAQETSTELTQTATVYFGLMGALELDWLRARIDALPRHSHWQRKARTDLLDEVYGVLRSLTLQVLCLPAARSEPDAHIQGWIEHNAVAVEHCRNVFTEIKAQKALDYTILAVAVREIHNLAHNGR